MDDRLNRRRLLAAGGALLVHGCDENERTEFNFDACDSAVNGMSPTPACDSPTADNPEFQLMRQRVELSFIEDDAESAQYGLVLALTRNGEYAEARKLLKPLREFTPTNMTYALAEVDIDIEEGKLDAAIDRLQRGLKLVPNNHPITMTLAKAYYESKRFHDADVLLTAHSRNKPKDPNLWYVLAEVQGLAGNTLGLHRSRAEYFAYTGSLKRAIQQLNYALPLTEDEITKERINNRMMFFRQVSAALGQL